MVVMQNMFYNMPFPPILKMYTELPMATISKSEGHHVTHFKWTNKQLCVVALFTFQRLNQFEISPYVKRIVTTALF
jgi:hypothetical protein